MQSSLARQTDGKTTLKGPLQVSVYVVLTVFAVILCWSGVSWALRPGLFPMMDELGDLAGYITAPYGLFFTLLPHAPYNDRPVGFAFVKLLFSFLSFDYRRDLMCYLPIHFANCSFGYLIFRRLGVSVPLSIGGIGLYSVLWTTAGTVTYLGEASEVLCLFFLLGSTLAFLSKKRGATTLSAVLFLVAMRTKEFAIMTPAVFGALALFLAPPSSARQTLLWIVRRLWMHLVIGLVFGMAYLSLIPQMRANILPGNPYHLQPDVGTILDSWSYYIALIFGQEYTILAHMPRVCGAALGAVLIYSLVRREFAVLFSLAGFVLFLLPASMLPNQREAFYALTPQLFLILLGCLLLERLFAIFSKSERVRWVAAVVVALTLMSWAATFRRSSYFGNRVSFITTVRSVSAVTAAEVTVLVPKLTAKTHLYINNRDQTAWLFAPGPCAYFKVATRGLPISCVMDQPADALRRLYASDQGPKYFLDYKQDGSLTLADASPGPD